MVDRNEKGQFIKGHKGLNTGKTWFKKGQKIRLGARHSTISKKKMSKAKKGIIPSNVEIFKIGMLNRRGKYHPAWKGGKTDESKIWRKRIEYKLWREAVFIRDDYICQKCGRRGYQLHPHHIQAFAERKELRFAIDNGITFCISCHKGFHKLYGKKGISEKDILEYVQNKQTMGKMVEQTSDRLV